MANCSVYEKFFDIADEDKNGYLSRDELIKVMSCGGFDKKCIDSVFNQFDKNADGKVTKEEFVAAMTSIGENKMDEANMRKAFRAIDKDGSGKLERNELTQVLKAHRPDITESTITEILRAVDKDGDGVISYEEFLNSMNTIQEKCAK